MLAELAQRFQALQPALVREQVDRLIRVLSALHRIPAAYGAELAPVAAGVVQVLVDKLDPPESHDIAVSLALQAMVRLRLEVPAATRQRLREHALGAVREKRNRVPLYWVVRAMNEGCIGVPDNDAVEAVLRRIGARAPTQLLLLSLELQKISLDSTQWVQKYKAVRYLWVRTLHVVQRASCHMSDVWYGSTCLVLGFAIHLGFYGLGASLLAALRRTCTADLLCWRNRRPRGLAPAHACRAREAYCCSLLQQRAGSLCLPGSAPGAPNSRHMPRR
jgi:hypothetical protein